jgi:hypothetical protein
MGVISKVARNGQDGMYSQMEAITPEMASRWLESNNQSNRNFIPGKIVLYAADMVSGQWRPTHQGIAFDCFGKLRDGQNRLAAIVRSGVTVVMMVTRNLPYESMDSIDVGKSRTTADVLHLMGELCSRDTVAVMKAMLVSYRSQRGTASNILSNNSTLQTFHKAMAESIEFASYCPKKNRLSHACFIASMAAAYHTQPREMIARFKSQVDSGVVTSEKDNAAIRMRELLLDGRVSSGGGANRVEMFLRSCTALRAYIERRPISKLMCRDGARFPIPDVDGVK